jgi:hypothetical protein
MAPMATPIGNKAGQNRHKPGPSKIAAAHGKRDLEVRCGVVSFRNF